MLSLAKTPDEQVEKPLGGSAEPVAPAAPAAPAFREFDDVPTARKMLFQNVFNAVRKKYPIENSRYRLEVRNLRYDGPEDYGLAEQKEAVLRRRTLDRPLLGSWTLVDKATNQPVDTKQSVIARVPYLTDGGVFIYKGNKYGIFNQIRLNPGVFTRVRENGGIEGHINVRPGTGQGFRIYMEPETGIFRMGVGQATLKLYPVLRAMGASDEDLQKSWGSELLQRNRAADDPRAVSRAFARLVHTRADESVGGDDAEAVEKLASADRIPGGKADDEPDSAFPREELAEGVEHELEHTDSVTLAKEIAKDHLVESDDYYTKLEAMERKEAEDESDFDFTEDELGADDIPFMRDDDEFPVDGDYEIRESGVHGVGAFATRNFEDGETVGTVMIRDQDTDDADLDNARTALGRYVNHASSEKANCSLFAYGRTVKLKADKAIAAGEELLADYSQAGRWLASKDNQASAQLRSLAIALGRVVKR